MTNARSPYAKPHVCLVLNQTHKKKGLGLVKTLGSLGTPGLAPLLLSDSLTVKESLHAACVSEFANIYCDLLFYCSNLGGHTGMLAILSTRPTSQRTHYPALWFYGAVVF